MDSKPQQEVVVLPLGEPKNSVIQGVSEAACPQPAPARPSGNGFLSTLAAGADIVLRPLKKLIAGAQKDESGTKNL